MADDDFDIDIYGDTNNEQETPTTPAAKDEEGDIKIDGANNDDTDEANKPTEVDEDQDTEYVDIKVDSGNDGPPQEQRQQIKSTDESGKDALNIPKQAPQQQGVKRKEGSDERPIDPGATTALLISDLHWWNTDDDIRGWINQAQCEDELKEITFSEHKVNGKSKGQAYVEFSSQQAATAAKHKIDAFGEGQQYIKKHIVTYSNPNVNLFKTLPKDAPMRAGKDGPTNRPVAGNYNDRTQQSAGNNYGGNFRGRGGYNRGNMNNNMGGGFNRNFQNPGMGGMGGNFQAPMGGFNAGSMGGGQFSGGFNRGGMMNNMRGGPGVMRGGRGGMNGGMMGGMPMGGMQMGGMPGAMPGMGGPMNMGMGAGMPGAGFPGMQPHFNPAFFPQNQATGGDWQNPHGAKRPRPDINLALSRSTGIMNIRTEAFRLAKGDSELIPRQAVDSGNPGYSPPENCECYRKYRFDEHKGPFLGFLTVALTLVIIAALLAGLTLAISSLDMTWLQIMSTTGSKRRRHQAEIVSRIKRNASWFLCSMVLASVVCMETLPIIVQSLFGTGWIPVIVSTVAIAIFSELLPQYLIPRQALLWSYYCWPFIWTCMWLTAIISWPLSFVLDRLTLPKERGYMYTSEQLAVLIRLHERQEKHGGHLGPDAGRVARGAIDLDGRTLEKSPLGAFYDNKSITDGAGDPEKAYHTTSDIIVPWSAVKFIRIDDPVNEQFITKIKQFSYSRIPVVGNKDLLAIAPTDNGNAPSDQRIFGFLHIKTLLGLDLQNSGKEIRVRDLPLYPLPIVRDDLPLYDLLNMFQLGISRMAVVILAPARDWTDNQATPTPNRTKPTRTGAPLWSSATGVNARGSLDLRELGGRVDWITDFLNATRDDASDASPSFIVTGIRCPAPLGIITFEDILDTLLQKTSRDEKDFFERRTFDPPTKTRKEGDDNTVRSSQSIFRSRRAIPTHVSGAHVAFGGNSCQSQGVLRRRIPSKNTSAADGAADPGAFGLDGNDDRDVSEHEALTADHSSYTENSEGGFHGPSSSAETELSTLAQRNISVNHKLRRLKGRSVISSRTVSSPENPTESGFQLGLDILPRHSSYGFSPFVGEAYDATSYEREVPGLDELPANPEGISEAEEILPDTLVGGIDQPNVSSSYYSFHSDVDSRPETSEAVGHIANENARTGWGINTLPRMNFGPQLAIGNIMSQEIHPREKSFHDDRSLLPSQWRDIESGDSKENTARRTSFWI
ncbi:hypothetical protein V502_03020 [Pseudogymnoascus sp. VKM F-4520 (FW-2644)]|nr:hypothetical protein V502_03020 [Pseudogymnoascus sp. VKM F-4520 (FW-2644)]